MKRQQRVMSAALTVLLLGSAGAVCAATAPALTGTWGYTVLGHGNAGDKGFFSWKTESGTMQFNGDGTGHTEYQESADVCPNANYCMPLDAYDFTYSAVQNADGTVSATMKRAGSAGSFTMRFAISDDGTMLVADGTRFPANEQMSIMGVKLDAGHTYSNADASGDYYNVGYEHDLTGGDHGYYRSWTLQSTMDGSGGISQSGNLKADAAVLTGISMTDTYSIGSAGAISVAGGAVKGYVNGAGSVAVMSNPGPSGGVKDDFASFLALKKADKTYAASDLAGTWVFTAFGDDDGSKFFTSFGALNCDAAGNCSAIYTSKNSNRGSILKEKEQNLSLQLAADGSINGFLFDSSLNGFAGAVGNNGNTLVLNGMEIGTNHRALITAVRCSVCVNPAGVPDAVGPDIIVNTPASYSISATSPTYTVTVSGAVTDADRGDNGVAALTVNGENALAGVATGTHVAMWSKDVVLANGSNRIELVSTDFAGARKTRVIRLNYLQDIIGPVQHVKYPLKPVMALYADLQGTAFDREKNGVKQVLVNTGSVLAAPVAGKLKAVWKQTVPLSLGANSILVQAADNLDNVGEQTVVVTRIADTLPPVLKVTNLVNNQHVKVAAQRMDGKVSDAKAGANGVASVTVSLNGGPDVAVAGGIANRNETASWSTVVELVKGANTLVVRAADASGENAGATKTLTVYADIP